MGIGIATGENRAVEAAKKAISSPLLETSIDGAKGVIMNITGGTNLSLFEVQEAAEIVADASDEEVNMIFGSVINENLNDEIIVTVIATGFSDEVVIQPASRPSLGGSRLNNQTNSAPTPSRAVEQQQPQQEQPRGGIEDTLEVPTFLRNRRNR